jgi:hypothetical protein
VASFTRNAALFVSARPQVSTCAPMDTRNVTVKDPTLIPIYTLAAREVRFKNRIAAFLRLDVTGLLLLAAEGADIVLAQPMEAGFGVDLGSGDPFMSEDFLHLVQRHASV